LLILEAHSLPAGSGAPQDALRAPHCASMHCNMIILPHARVSCCPQKDHAAPKQQGMRLWLGNRARAEGHRHNHRRHIKADCYM
jgi:hypothetical protein